MSELPSPKIDELKAKVGRWAQRLGVQPKVVRVQRMTTKWGSCSTSGTISLALDLPDQTPEFQDFVIAHELLHLKVPMHGRVFHAILGVHIPDWRTHESARRRRML
jgi:predicted metal-dependent hydrolase